MTRTDVSVCFYSTSSKVSILKEQFLQQISLPVSVKAIYSGFCGTGSEIFIVVSIDYGKSGKIKKE